MAKEPRWHPILAAVEGPTGTWRMLDGFDREYGTIEIRRVMNDTDVRYKCVFRGEVIGWSTSLKLGAEQIHRAFLRSHTSVPFAGYPPIGGRHPD